MSSLLLTILGLGALAAVRVQMRSARLAGDSVQARACAASAVELGLLSIGQDPNWRDTWSSGTWIQNRPLGAGYCSLAGVDPQDNVLNDSAYDALVLTGTGTKGIARHKTEVTLVPVVEPLAVLKTCLHSAGPMQIKAGRIITVLGGPISTNGQLDNDEMIDGDAEALSQDHMVAITGTLTIPAPVKPMPAAAVITTYADKATVVPYIGTIEKIVLTPSCNPWGPADPNGLYFLDTAGHDLLIRNARIHGTLVIRAIGKTVTFDDAVFFQNYRSDLPTLLVEGSLTIKTHSVEEALSESANATNYNPPGASYEGVYDDDMLDSYPNEVRGLIHATGDLVLQQTARVVGTVVCGGATTCDGTNTIIYDPGLYACPPAGYTFVERMMVSPGSWRQVVD